mgnify:FL=1
MINLKQVFSKKVVLITKDINFRVKCDSLGIKSEDYYKDKIVLENAEAFKGFFDLLVEEPGIINRLYSYINNDEETDVLEEFLDLCEEKIGRNPHANEYFCIKSGSSSFLGRWDQGKIEKIHQAKELMEEFQKLGISPKNREQLYALNSLLDVSLPLVTISGLAGSGKTFITLMSAYSLVQAGYYDRIVITRNITPVGRDIGFLPGTADDKMSPWLAPIMDNFRVGLKDNNLSLFQTLKEQGVIEVAPLSFIRGRTFNNSILIMDEAQNATIHELKTVITRMGENSKIILLGDVDQIDTPYIDTLSNGLTVVSEKFKNQDCASHIALKRGERSYLSAVAAKII